MEMSGQLHPRGKNSLERRLGGLQNPSEEARKKLFYPAENLNPDSPVV
jgi:hypothetical protein